MRAAVAAPEQELALLLCQTAPERELCRAAIVELARRVDYDELAAALNSARLLTTCGARLRAACQDTLPTAFTAALDLAEAQQRARSLLFEAATVDIWRALETGGITTLPLKGALLARRIYVDAPSKPSVDIDVLVARSDLPAARQLIESRAYVEVPDGTPRDRLPDLHYAYVSPNHLPPVELHWRIHLHETRFSERMLARSSLDASGVRRAELHDEFAALLLFYQRDTFTGLRLAADVAAWWDVYGGELAPGSLTPILDEHPELRESLLAAAAMAQRVVGVPAPPLFGDARISRRRTDWAMRISDWTLRDSNPRTQSPDRRLLADMALIDALMTPDGLYQSYLRRHLLDDSSTSAGGDRRPENPQIPPPIRRMYEGTVRAVKGIAHFGARLWEIRGGRFLHPLPASVAQRLAVSGCGEHTPTR